MADGMAMTTMLLLCPMTTIGSISYFASLGISRLENYVACVAFLSRWVYKTGYKLPSNDFTDNKYFALFGIQRSASTHRYTTDRRVGQKMFRRHLACWDLIYLIPLAPYFDDSMLGTKIFTGTTHLGSW